MASRPRLRRPVVSRNGLKRHSFSFLRIRLISLLVCCDWSTEREGERERERLRKKKEAVSD